MKGIAKEESKAKGGVGKEERGGERRSRGVTRRGEKKERGSRGLKIDGEKQPCVTVRLSTAGWGGFVGGK